MSLTFNRKMVSPSMLSILLLAWSGLWLAGAGAWYFHGANRVGLASMPLPWMMVLMVAPVVCFALGSALVMGRQAARWTWLERCALGASAFAVFPGGWLAEAILSVIHGVVAA